MVYSILLSPIWSAVTDAYVKADFAWLKKTLKIYNYFSLFFIIVVIIMILASSWIYKIWVGNKVIIPFGLSVAIGLNTIIKLCILPYSHFINGIGKLNLTVSLAFFEILIYLILIFIFGNLFNNSIGIILAIVATGLLGFLQPVQTHKLLNRTAKGLWNR
jgi:hypothetical protein